MIEMNKIYNMDCLNGMKMIPDQSVDLILTDPPYGIYYESNRRKDKFDNLWDINFDIVPFFNEMWRILSNNGIMYLFGRWDTIKDYPMKPSGMLIWDKRDMGMGDLKFWSMSYELISIFKKGNAGFEFSKRPTGMLRFYKEQNFKTNRLSSGRLDYQIHPTIKPLNLIRHILKFHNPNIVLDPFMGSGTTAVACKEQEKDYIGFELDPKYCKIAEERLKKVPRRLDKFV